MGGNSRLSPSPSADRRIAERSNWRVFHFMQLVSIINGRRNRKYLSGMRFRRRTDSQASMIVLKSFSGAKYCCHSSLAAAPIASLSLLRSSRMAGRFGMSFSSTRIEHLAQSGPSGGTHRSDSTIGATPIFMASYSLIEPAPAPRGHKAKCDWAIISAYLFCCASRSGRSSAQW